MAGPVMQSILSRAQPSVILYRPVNVSPNALISRSASASFDRNMKRFAPGSSTIRAVGTQPESSVTRDREHARSGSATDGSIRWKRCQRRL